eukprot:631732-Amphidinium_carterae.1
MSCPVRMHRSYAAHGLGHLFRINIPQRTLLLMTTRGLSIAQVTSTTSSLLPRALEFWQGLS